MLRPFSHFRLKHSSKTFRPVQTNRLALTRARASGGFQNITSGHTTGFKSILFTTVEKCTYSGSAEIVMLISGTEMIAMAEGYRASCYGKNKNIDLVIAPDRYELKARIGIIAFLYGG